MASSDFANRFKDKIEKIGKSGLNSLNILNPIEKIEIPESKIHRSVLISVQSKPRIIMQNSEIDAKNCSSKQTTRSKSSLRLLPPLRGSPSKLVMFQQSKILDDSQEVKIMNTGRSQVIRTSCNSLPKINSRIVTVKSILKTSKRIVESIKKTG
jgi:hypothetical protein